MLSSAIMILIVSSIFGLIILKSVLNNQPTQKIIAFWHGPIALIGLILILVAIYYGDHHPLIIATALLFIFAAIGGLTLFIMDMFQKSLPKWLVIGHAILALIGIILLVMYVLHWKKDARSIYAERQEVNSKHSIYS